MIGVSRLTVVDPNRPGALSSVFEMYCPGVRGAANVRRNRLMIGDPWYTMLIWRITLPVGSGRFAADSAPTREEDAVLIRRIAGVRAVVPVELEIESVDGQVGEPR